MNSPKSSNTLVVGLSEDSNRRFLLDYIQLENVTKPVILVSSTNSELVKHMKSTNKFNYVHSCSDMQALSNEVAGVRKFTLVIDDIEVAGDDRYKYKLANEVCSKFGNSAELIVLYNRSGIAYIDDVTELTLKTSFKFSEAYDVSEKYESMKSINKRRNF